MSGPNWYDIEESARCIIDLFSEWNAISDRSDEEIVAAIRAEIDDMDRIYKELTRAEIENARASGNDIQWEGLQKCLDIANKHLEVCDWDKGEPVITTDDITWEDPDFVVIHVPTDENGYVSRDRLYAMKAIAQIANDSKLQLHSDTKDDLTPDKIYPTFLENAEYFHLGWKIFIQVKE